MYHIDYRYLRPKKAAWLKIMYDTPLERKEALSVWHGRNATILPLCARGGDNLLFGRGGVVDENGQYVELSGIPTRIWGSYAFPKAEYRDETVVYCGFLVNHWGHFLVEAVTRLWYALENDTGVDKYVFFLNENEQRELKGNYREFFRLLGILDKIEIINQPTTYREVIVPEIAFRCMEFYSPRFLAIFDAIADRIVPSPEWVPEKKIFFTRTGFSKGNNLEFGGECLDNFFLRNGFTVLHPERLSLSQMIYQIRNAEEIATISGSAHHNMLFAQNGQRLLILERLVINVDYQVSINRMRGLGVTPIDANFHLYTVDTAGPLMLGYNHILERYISDNGLVPPDKVYCSKKYRDSCFKAYMASYQDNYRYRWHMEPWYPEIADSLYEAYEDNYPYFKEYLDGNRPFLKEHYFQIHYWKQLLKRLIHYHP